MKTCLRSIINHIYRLYHLAFPFQWQIKVSKSCVKILKNTVEGDLLEVYVSRTNVASLWLTKGNVSSSNTYCVVYSLYVQPRFRQLSLATKLLKHSFELAQQAGFRELLVITSPQNKAAVNMYHKLGFINYKLSENALAYEAEIALYTDHQERTAFYFVMPIKDAIL